VRVLLLRWYVVQWWRLWVSSSSEEIDSISHCPALCNHHLPLDSFVPGVTRQAVAHLRPRGGLALLYDTPRCVQLLSTYVKAWLLVTYCWDGVHPLGFKRDLFTRTSHQAVLTRSASGVPPTQPRGTMSTRGRKATGKPQWYSEWGSTLKNRSTTLLAHPEYKRELPLFGSAPVQQSTSSLILQ